MKKVYSILCILILLKIYAITAQITCGTTTPIKADDCNDDSITQYFKDFDLVHCCYVHYEKNSDSNECKALTSKQYKNIKKYIKLLEENNDYKYEIKIDCQSPNLQIFLFSLLIQFILF